jgi:acyl carrier protein
MYNIEGVQKQVTQIITDKLGVPESEITPDASFVRDLGIDSLDYAELVMEFEQTFNIKIPDNDAERMNTIGEAVDYIMSKLEMAKP